ncbi:hypothetical protein JCM10213_008823 [Rhodosporidiobolus nylandii]
MSSDRARLRCTINDLPAELKAKIVEHCAAADEAFRSWHTALKPFMPHELASHAREQQTCYGRCISALFRTSKTWSEIAAPFRFRILRASRVDSTFHLYVQASRLAHFKEVHLDSADLTALSFLLSRLPALPSVSTLAIQRNALRAILGRFWAWSEEGVWDEPSASPFFARFAPRARRLVLQGGVTSDVNGLLRIFGPHLQSLALHDLEGAWEETGGKTLAQVLSMAPSLDSLELRARDKEQLDIGLHHAISVPPSSVAPLPALKSLSILTNSLTPPILEFCTLFAPSLRSLVLDLSTETVDPTPRLDNSVFPLLDSLKLVADPSHLYEFLDSIESRHFPALTSLDLDMPSDGSYEDDVWLGFIGNLPRLRDLRLYRQSALHPDDAQDLRAYFDGTKVAVRTTPAAFWPCDTFFLAEHHLRGDYDEEELLFHGAALESARNDVQRLARFLTREADRADRTGDDIAMVRLARANQSDVEQREARRGSGSE